MILTWKYLAAFDALREMRMPCRSRQDHCPKCGQVWPMWQFYFNSPKHRGMLQVCQCLDCDHHGHICAYMNRRLETWREWYQEK
eukprot:9753577-Karenia_brevis.AAC.1